MSWNLENKIHDCQVSFFRGFLWSFQGLDDYLFSNTQLAVWTFWLFIFPICLWSIGDCPLFGLQLWLGWTNALKQYKRSCLFFPCMIRIMLLIRFVVRKEFCIGSCWHNFGNFALLLQQRMCCFWDHPTTNHSSVVTRAFLCWWHLKLSKPVVHSFLFLGIEMIRSSWSLDLV